MQPAPPYPAPAHWWQTRASGLLLHWKLRLVTYSVGFFFPFSRLCCPLRFQTPHRPASEKISSCLETSPSSRIPPQDGSLSLTLLPLFLSVIFCPTSFQRELVAFLGALCPLLAFRSCFMEVLQHSNDLLMNFGGRKRSPRPIPPVFWGHPSTLFLTQRQECTMEQRQLLQSMLLGKLDSYM